MLRRSFVAAAVGAGAITEIKAQTTLRVKTGYAPVNGLKLYYEIHGSGDPLILLHGGLGSTGMFTELLPALTAKRRVIAVDLQGHGRTADIDRPISLEAMAGDIAALAQYLELSKVDIMGYSMGGGVALRTTIQHPALIRKMVIVSTTYRRDGWYPEILAAMGQLGPAAAEAMKPSPLYHLYSRVAPRPGDWSRLVTKMGAMMQRDFDWTKEVAAIQAPAMLVFGDADAVRTAHAVEFFELLGGGQKDGGWDGSGISRARLAILPGLTHYTVFSSPALGSTVTPFLS